jgi:adenosylhomocysteine nucleosidase
MTLVFFAVEEEARPFTRLAGCCPDIRSIVSGMGRTATEIAVTRAFEQYSPARVLTCGFAGALDPLLRTGQVLFSADTDFPLAEHLENAGGRRGSFFCSSAVLTTAVLKAAARRESGADAVEMESEWIRSFCQSRGIPSATVRVVLDEAGSDLPLDFNTVMGPDQKIVVTRLAGAILRRPAVVPALLRLGAESRRAARTLGEVLWATLNPRATPPGYS